MNKIAVVRIRGHGRLDRGIRDTLQMLRLTKQHTCVIIVDNAINRGMVRKVKDYVTWGIIDEAFFLKLVEKRGKLYVGRDRDRRRWIEIDGKKYQKQFTLHPPLKGYGRKGIKKGYAIGGALGDRGDKITELITRMM